MLTTLLWGAVLLALLAGSMVKLVRRFVSRFGLPLVVLSLLWLTWQFATQLQAKGWRPSGRARATAAWACSARSTW